MMQQLMTVAVHWYSSVLLQFTVTLHYHILHSFQTAVYSSLAPSEARHLQGPKLAC